MLRLPHEVVPLFREWLDVHYPERAGKVMAIVQSVRANEYGGRDNDPGFFTRMKPQGVWADVFRARFQITCQRLKMNEQRLKLDCAQFRRPSTDGQLRLL